jgi:hypothetical protein
MMVQWDRNASEHNQGFYVIHRVNKEYYGICSYLNWNPDTMCMKGSWNDQNHNDNTTWLAKYKFIEGKAQCLQDGSYNGRLMCSKWSQLNAESTVAFSQLSYRWHSTFSFPRQRICVNAFNWKLTHINFVSVSKEKEFILIFSSIPACSSELEFNLTYMICPVRNGKISSEQFPWQWLHQSPSIHHSQGSVTVTNWLNT